MDISSPMKIYMPLGVGIQEDLPDKYCRLEFLVIVHIWSSIYCDNAN